MSAPKPNTRGAVSAPRSNTRGAMKRHQRGQALTEYALLCSLLIAALFVPFFPAPQGGLESVFELSIQAFDIYIRSFHSVLMLPIP
jgi:hypothetical protein